MPVVRNGATTHREQRATGTLAKHKRRDTFLGAIHKAEQRSVGSAPASKLLTIGNQKRSRTLQAKGAAQRRGNRKLVGETSSEPWVAGLHAEAGGMGHVKEWLECGPLQGV